jgi:hypothetical protein
VLGILVRALAPRLSKHPDRPADSVAEQR